jgi:DNA invertase Pin-like site-specific DNA recombinase
MAEPGPAHLRRDAYIYVRQSTLAQTVRNTESLARQYDLAGRARELGWAEHQVVVVDDDLGRSGASAHGRKGFSDLVADVGLGKAGIVLSLECSRLARNNSDWYQLLDLCALTDTLIADADGLYHPGLFNDRLVPQLSDLDRLLLHEWPGQNVDDASLTWRGGGRGRRDQSP